MPGLNNFRGGAAAPTTPAPTTYTGSYATTAQDARDKCQGNTVASVTRTATSTVNLVDAITKAKALALTAIVCPVFTGSYTTTDADSQAACQGNLATKVTRTATSGKDQPTADAAAKAAALAAIVCPVFFGTYTTTPEDYRAACGANTSGKSVTRTANSGKDQATADAAAKSLALAGITCPLPYDTTLTASNPEGGAISFSTDNGHELLFNRIAGAKGAPANVYFKVNGQTSAATIPSEYLDAPCALRDSNGMRHDYDVNGNQVTFLKGTINL